MLEGGTFDIFHTSIFSLGSSVSQSLFPEFLNLDQLAVDLKVLYKSSNLLFIRICCWNDCIYYIRIQSPTHLLEHRLINSRSCGGECTTITKESRGESHCTYLEVIVFINIVTVTIIIKANPM